MKKTAVILLLVFFIFQAGTAENFEVGLRGNFSLITAAGGKEVKETKASIGFGGTLFGAYTFTDLIALQAEVEFSAEKYSYTPISDLYGKGSAAFSAMTLSIPVLARFSFLLGQGNAHLFIGPHITMFLAGQKYEDDSESQESDFLRPVVNVGITAGADYCWRIGPGSIVADLRLTFDFLNRQFLYGWETVRIGHLIRFMPSVGYKLHL
ncbi:PorT family protein [Brucepastera parasyntrophica]|uniref:outer membrane beta-barrel protein n=1 Tax=Brucepastera parasyntrophica TaxID=2880008 RepID=UPI00210BAC12|nr:outer membrane beta-barrel protein [Brucepastera parasyntrophica]ULQ59537.1 PorT family protein [Brucepastera parasyntrophica]